MTTPDMPSPADVTDAELAEIEARAAAATPGPWIAYDQNEGGSHAPLWAVANNAFFNPHDDTECDAFGADVTCGGKDDAAFIAAAREAVPRLAAALRTAREELARADPAKVAAWITERDELANQVATVEEENALLRSWLDEVGTVVSGAVGDRHVDQPPAEGVRQIVAERDQARRIADAQLNTRDRVETVLDAALGTDEEDGTGEGLAADVALVVEQRDEARTSVHRYFGHAGEPGACAHGICYVLHHPGADVPPPRFDLGNPLDWTPDQIRRAEEAQAAFVTDEEGVDRGTA